MALSILGLVFILIAVMCFIPVLLHAFQRSLGTGFMVLCIPVYPLVYGFTQFEHPKKGILLASWIGLFVLGVMMRFLGTAVIASS